MVFLLMLIASILLLLQKKLSLPIVARYATVTIVYVLMGLVPIWMVFNTVNQNIMSTLVLPVLILVIIIFDIAKTIQSLAFVYNKKIQNTTAFQIGVIIISILIKIVVLFTIGYSILFFLNPSSISGLNVSNSISLYIDLLYFSVVTFTTLGYGDILAVSEVAKIVVMLEVITFTFIISFVVVNCYKENK